jgi:long-chain fatty acid transport protein
MRGRIGGRSVLVVLLALGTTLIPAPARAGGLFLYEVGTPDVGYAAAGNAARAEEPSTLLFNPAGMTRLEGTQVQGGLQALVGYLKFAPNQSTTPAGSDGGNAIGLFPGGSAFVTHALTEDFRVGMGMYSNFGLAEKWKDDWVGRYYTQQSALLGISFEPAVAYRIIDGLSIGAGLNVMYGYLKDTVAVNNAPFGVQDGKLELSSGTWGVGGNAGLLYEFSKGARVGVTYTSPVKLDFTATPKFSDVNPVLTGALKFTGLYNTKVDLGMTVPQTVMASFYYDLTDRWALLGDVGWQNWARFGRVEVSVATTTPTSLTTNVGYKDTWHAALGAQYQLSDPWRLTFGLAYDSSMTTASTRTLALPLGDAWRFGFGAKYALNKDLDLGLAYEFLWGGSPSVDVNRGPLAGRVAGNYNNTWIHFVALNATWKF